MKKIYRYVLLLIALLGVTMQIAKDGFGMLLYYTVISNVLVALFLIYALKVKQENNQFYLLKGAITMSITITFLIYHFMLAALVTHAQFYNVRNFIVHYIVPIGMILDTLIFDKRKVYKILDPFIWTSIPLLYFGLAMLNGFIFKLPIPNAPDSPFPYFFMNVVKYGINYVLINFIVIFIGYLVVGYGILIAKNLIGKKQSNLDDTKNGLPSKKSTQ